MSKVNSWYVLAVQDKRYKFDFHPVLNRSHVFYDLKKAHNALIKRQPYFKGELVILRRTCEVLK